MNLHLAEIATQIAPGAHAALLVDQASWHLSGGLIVPPNITLIPLPAKCPELNPHYAHGLGAALLKALHLPLCADCVEKLAKWPVAKISISCTEPQPAR
jgi:hypothetical protein